MTAAPLKRHVKLLPKGHWVRPTLLGPEWGTEWNSGEGGAVSCFLATQFQLSSHEPLYILLMREVAYQAPVATVAAHRRLFAALDDEGLLMLHPPTGRYVLLGTNGYLGAGLRLNAS